MPKRNLIIFLSPKNIFSIRLLHRQGAIAYGAGFKNKKMRPGAEVPQRATEGAAGLDLRACIDAPVTLAPGGLAMIPSGIAVSLPGSGYAAFVFAAADWG